MIEKTAVLTLKVRSARIYSNTATDNPPSINDAPLLRAQDLTHAYRADQAALRSVSLTVGAGCIVYLLGRNGSGKTTLMRCLSGVLRPQQGQVWAGGDPLLSLSAAERARRVGLIPQTYSIPFAYTVRQIVLMGRAPHLGLFGVPRARDAAIAEDALAEVGLADLADRPFSQLSGGQQQLVMIARGLAQQCRVLLMDEPDAHLDLNNQQRVMQVVTRLAEQGVSFVVASHVPNNALVYAHEALLLKRGEVLASGDPAHILTEPLLTAAYDLEIEVIRSADGQAARAVLPRRP
jgi:iron complex transport system ATP-binding protein